METIKINRFELIDQTGRRIVINNISNVLLSLQDEGGTLKLFCVTGGPINVVSGIRGKQND